MDGICYGYVMGYAMDIWMEYAMSMSMDRRLGGESDREISMVPVCVILSLGFWSSISPPGLGVGVGVGRALGYGA